MATVPESEIAAQIAARVAAGDYVGAAGVAEAAGQLQTAIKLYERVWRFADAVPLALRLPDVALAVRLSLDARDDRRAAALAAELLKGASTAATSEAPRPAELSAVAEVFARRSRWLEAAPLFEAAGADARAAELYEKGGALFEAARAYVRAGDWRKGGRLYEEVAATAAAEGELQLQARALLGFGTLCGQLGRPREAARALQAAAEHGETRLAALAQLSPQLAALDLPHAAALVAARFADEARATPLPTAALVASLAGDSGGQLPRFAELQLIGAGSLGRVYRARDRLLGVTVVLKILAVGAGREGSERLAFRQFLREAEASGRLRHPNIVRVHDIDERAGLLVLEHLPGGTLGERIAAEGALSLAATRRWALDVLSALATAHRAGIVHRDVKPANVFLDAAGNAKLADFGAAHLADFGGTQTAGFIGTLGYLSPEQISGGLIGPAADLYALAATLFESLTGRLPYLGPDVAGQHLAEPPPSAAALVPSLPAVCDEVIRRALAKNPADRFASAEAMADAVRGWPAQAAPPAAPRASAGAVTPPAPVSTPILALASPTPPPETTALGRTARGALSLRHDPRLGRAVLAETLDQPLDASERAALSALAAAGGPNVQRVLRIDDEPAPTVFYELIAAPAVPLSTLPADEATLLATCWPALAAAGLLPAPETPVARTGAGPVILVVGARPAAYSAAT
jgi:serine/threonine-protein kinase